jgi:hypothetical protein
VADAQLMVQAKETSDTRALIAVLLGGGGMALAAVVLAWQFYTWLKTGHWPYLSMTTLTAPLVSGSEFSEWLAAPQSWHGLHTIVKFLLDLPLWGWIVSCASGILFAFLKD